MAKPKANSKTISYADLRAEFLLDEYIDARPENCLPGGWGRTLNQRRYNAKFLALFSEHPELLKVPQSIFNKRPDLHADLSRQILFAQLFAADPDHFIAFVQHFRDANRRLPQEKTVAILLLSENRALLESSDEIERTDKEVAVT